MTHVSGVRAGDCLQRRGRSHERGGVVGRRPRRRPPLRLYGTRRVTTPCRMIKMTLHGHVRYKIVHGVVYRVRVQHTIECVQYTVGCVEHAAVRTSDRLQRRGRSHERGGVVGRRARRRPPLRLYGTSRAISFECHVRISTRLIYHVLCTIHI